MGRTFHFLDVPGSRPRSQYIFLIHNQETTFQLTYYRYIFPLNPINFTYSTLQQTIFYWHPILPLSSFSIYQQIITRPLQHSHPTPGILSLTKNIPKYYPIPSPTYTSESLTFPSKMPKNGLKSLFFNR